MTLPPRAQSAVQGASVRNLQKVRSFHGLQGTWGGQTVRLQVITFLELLRFLKRYCYKGGVGARQDRRAAEYFPQSSRRKQLSAITSLDLQRLLEGFPLNRISPAYRILLHQNYFDMLQHASSHSTTGLRLPQGQFIGGSTNFVGTVEVQRMQKKKSVMRET